MTAIDPAQEPEARGAAPAPAAAPPPAPMTLLDLAKEFDETDPDNLERRIALAEQMKILLGPHAENFDGRYEAQGCIAATAVLCEMGLVFFSPDLAAQILEETAQLVRYGGCTDWIDIMRRIQRDLLAILYMPGEVVAPMPQVVPTQRVRRPGWFRRKWTKVKRWWRALGKGPAS